MYNYHSTIVVVVVVYFLFSVYLSAFIWRHMVALFCQLHSGNQHLRNHSIWENKKKIHILKSQTLTYTKRFRVFFIFIFFTWTTLVDLSCPAPSNPCTWGNFDPIHPFATDLSP